MTALRGALALLVTVSGVPRADGDAEVDDSLREEAKLRDHRLAPRNDTVFVSFTQLHDDELSSRDVRISVGAPLLRGDGYGVGLFQRYTSTAIDSDRFLSHGLELHRFDLHLGGGGRIADGWSLRGGLGVTYASDLNQGSPSFVAMHSTAAVLVRHVLGPSDAWSAGVAYASTSNIYPILPILGYVHQGPGSSLRLDIELPHHVRVEDRISRSITAAFGLETHGDVWLVTGMHRNLDARRDGGAIFGEIGLAAYGPVEVDLRLGISVDSYTLPDVMTDTTTALSLRASSFGQVLVVVR